MSGSAEIPEKEVPPLDIVDKLIPAIAPQKSEIFMSDSEKRNARIVAMTNGIDKIALHEELLQDMIHLKHVETKCADLKESIRESLIVPGPTSTSLAQLVEVTPIAVTFVDAKSRMEKEIADALTNKNQKDVADELEKKKAKKKNPLEIKKLGLVAEVKHDAEVLKETENSEDDFLKHLDDVEREPIARIKSTSDELDNGKENFEDFDEDFGGIQ